MHLFKKYSHKGFTLLEILLVVAIIAILAGIVIVAINPAKQLGSTRDAERKSDLGTIYKAVNQYLIDKGHLPSGISTTTLTEICNTGTTPGTDSPTCDSSLVNLSILVPTYLTSIPADPQGSLLSFLPFIPHAHATLVGNGYKIQQVKNNIYLEAPNTEIGYTTQPGYSTTTPVAAFVGQLPINHTPPLATGGSGGTGGGNGGGGPAMCSGLSTGLQGYWKLDTSSPVDSSGHSNDGTINGGVTTGDTGPTVNITKAYNFDGTGGYVQTPNVVGGSADITFISWFKSNSLDNLAGWPWLIGSLGNSGWYGNLAILIGPYISYTTNTGGAGVDSDKTIADLNWHFIATTMSSSNGQTCFYLDGASPSCYSFDSTPIGGGYTYIGTGTWAGVNYSSAYSINGKVAGVALWNTALTSDQISQLYNGGAGCIIQVP